MVLRRLLAAAGALALVGAGLALTTSPATAASSAPLRYVALGDSYSAGSGIWPVDPGAPLLCLRSTSNYPHVVAAATGAALTDVTCGAAQTRDLRAAQYREAIRGWLGNRINRFVNAFWPRIHRLVNPP